MILIEVKPAADKWGVFIDGELFATSKHSFACDHAAQHLAKILADSEIRNYPELRRLK
jgi:hypothetical protein